jgi:hypothetical protein
VTPASGSLFNQGTVVPIDASPAAGYSFSSWTGNVASASSASTTITMNGAQAVTANFVPQATSLGGTITGKTGAQNARVWALSITNNGPGVANGAAISSFTLTQVAGAACTPVVTGPFPMSLGNLAPSGTASPTVTIDFTGCALAAKFTLDAELSANSSAAGGSIIRYNQFR